MLKHICIVRRDLPVGLMAANLVHAAGESSPGNLPDGTRVVALHAVDEKHLRSLAQRLETREVQHHVIHEEGEMFAIGIKPLEDGNLGAVRKVTSSLKLVC